MSYDQRVDNVCDLPMELLELIMTYMSYDDIAKTRSVCRLFDSCSQRLLNRGFVKVEKYHSLCFKRVKTQLPRRESERRSHALARHCDVLSAIETRLSLLGMTYMKYVEMSLCCFIPGKVIDEIYRVLRFIQNNPNPPRVHELLQELRDISSMAMEYFEEKIAPSLKNKLTATTSVITSVMPMGGSSMTTCHRSLPSTSGGSPLYSPQRVNVISESETKSSNVWKQMQTSQNTIKKELTEIKVKFKDFFGIKRELNAMKTKLRDTEKTALEKDQTIAELRADLEDLKRRMSEYDKKNALKTIKDEHQLETKVLKRKSSRIAKTNAKRIRIQTAVTNKPVPIEVVVPAMEVVVFKETKTRQMNMTPSKPTTRSTRSSVSSVETPIKTTQINVQKRTKRVKK